MISRKLKAAYYFFAGIPMRISGSAYRRFGSPKSGTIKVHLGPGQKNYIKGWINVDSNFITGRCDVWADLRNKLPFRDDTVSAFYSHHVIEHLPRIDSHFKDVFRCLRPGGVYRVGGPNGDAAIRKYVEDDATWFSDWPDKRISTGGRFENFIFCRGEHLTILTPSFLEEIMTNSGFVDIRVVAPCTETHFGNYFSDCLRYEHENDLAFPHTLLLEAVKPD